MHLIHKLSAVALALLVGVLGSCADDEVAVEYEDWVVGEWSTLGVGVQTSSVHRFEFTDDGRVLHEVVYCNAPGEQLEYSWRPYGPDEVIVYDQMGGYVDFGYEELRVKRDPTRCGQLIVTRISDDGANLGEVPLVAGRVCLTSVVDCDILGCPPCATIWCDAPPEACEP